MKRGIITALAILIPVLSAPLAAQNTPSQMPIKTTEDLFYTYAGICMSGGYSKVTRNGWINGAEGTKKSTGYYAAPGLMLDIYAHELSGEFKWLFTYNNLSDKDAIVQHSFYSATAKYNFSMTPFFDLTTGLGVYFEGAPSTKSYSGAGGELTAGCVFNYSGAWDMKILFDLSARYGFFGQDAKSKKFNTGASLGVTKKVGRS
jgi:hypothetical protein